MSWTTTIAVFVAVVAAYEVVRHFVVKRLTKAWRSSAVRFVRRHKIQLESARFIDRVWIREALAQDPRIEAAVAELAATDGRAIPELRAQVDRYVEEIAPFFSLSAYYRFGAAIARRFLDFCFELVFDPHAFDAQAAKAPEGCVRVYVINHRANMDPLVLAYGLLRHVPMSYAVGEWAMVWPLHTMFRAFGSYFVRRGESDPLYHRVLARFLQIIASQGAVTGFFLEGGLTRDGLLRPPKTGLLDYLIGLRHDHPDREIVFLPVGLNYDRVFEDKILTGAGRPTELSWSRRLANVAGGIIWLPKLLVANLFRWTTSSHQKFGYAALSFGEPLSLGDWPGGHELHLLPDDVRRPAVRELAEELLYRRIGVVVPATPVPVVATAMLQTGPDTPQELKRRVRILLEQLRASAAPLALGRAFPSEAAESGIGDLDQQLRSDEEADQLTRMATDLLIRHGVLELQRVDGAVSYTADATANVLLQYYANSIAHHLDADLLTRRDHVAQQTRGANPPKPALTAR